MRAQPRRFVDAHMHLWDSATNPWYAFPVPGGDDFGMNLQLPRAFQDPFLPVDYRAAMAPADVVKSVHISGGIPASFAEAETRWVSSLADQNGLPNAIIGTLDPELPDEIERVLDRECRNPRFRGIRVLAGLDYTTSAAKLILSALEGRGLIYDAVAHPGGIAPLAEAMGDYPKLLVVLEHIGWPLSDDDSTYTGWQKEMAQLAARPLAHVKLSGLPMFIHNASLAQHRRYLDACIDLFGVERCMFGSNFPVDQAYCSFAELLETFEVVAADRGEDAAEALFATNAERVYRI